MSVHTHDVAPGVPGLTLESDELSVTVLPEKGCDIYTLVERQSGIDLLFKTPWGLRRPGPGSHPPNSAAQWLEYYPGGWQLLCPNGGGPSVEAGIEWGFHGEACLVPWRIEHVGENEARLGTRLFRAPLRIERHLVIQGPLLRIEEAIINEAPDPVEFVWGHHPAFGAPFLDAGCILTTGARSITADDLTPGTLLKAGSVHPWPETRTVQGHSVDLSAIPGPSEKRAHLAWLSDFDSGFFALTNPRLGFGIGVRWPLEVFSQAWFWQEVHSSPGFPWFRRAYVAAVEPCTTVPPQGLAAARLKGGSGLTLPGGGRQEVLLEAVLYRGQKPPVRIDPDGAVVFAEEDRRASNG